MECWFHLIVFLNSLAKYEVAYLLELSAHHLLKNLGPGKAGELTGLGGHTHLGSSERAILTSSSRTRSSSRWSPCCSRGWMQFGEIGLRYALWSWGAQRASDFEHCQKLYWAMALWRRQNVEAAAVTGLAPRGFRGLLQPILNAGLTAGLRSTAQTFPL